MALTEVNRTDFKPSQLETLEGTESNVRLLADLNNKYEHCKSLRSSFERQWLINLAFYYGKQNVTWLGQGISGYSKLYEPKVPEWRVRLIINKIRMIVRTEHAKVLSEKPRGFVIPASANDEDLAAARAGDAIYEHLQRELTLAKVIRRAVFWQLICGTAFLKDWYDPNKKDQGGVKGAIQVEPISPWFIFVPDLQEEEIESQEYVIHTLVKSKNWVRDMFGIDLPTGESSDSTLINPGTQASGSGQAQQTKTVAIREIWIKPNGQYPKGCVATWAGGRLLLKTEGWPFRHAEYPITKIDHIPSGRFYGDSVIPDVIPLQRELNKTRSSLLESQNRMAKPQLLAARGSIDPSKITSQPGLVITYVPGYPVPQPLPLQNIPSYVLDGLNRLQQDMDDITSQNDVTRGQAPPNVRTSTGLSFLIEQSDAKLSPTIASLEEGVEKLGRHLLSHVTQFWGAQRAIRAVGTNGTYDVFQFNRTDINGNTDFRIESGSAQPRSRAAKQAFIIELGDKGWIGPTQVLRYLEMAETGKLYEETQVDLRQVQRENVQLMEGVQVSVHNYDEHLVHIDEHRKKQKSQDYEAAEDEVKLNFEAHVEGHKAMVAAMFRQEYLPGDPGMDGIIKQIGMGQIPLPITQEEDQVGQGSEASSEQVSEQSQEQSQEEVPEGF